MRLSSVLPSLRDRVFFGSRRVTVGGKEVAVTKRVGHVILNPSQHAFNPLNVEKRTTDPPPKQRLPRNNWNRINGCSLCWYKFCYIQSPLICVRISQRCLYTAQIVFHWSWSTSKGLVNFPNRAGSPVLASGRHTQSLTIPGTSSLM